MQPDTTHSIQTEPIPADSLTIVGIAIIAYMLATVLHEGVGHGGACLLAGGQPLVISTVQFTSSVARTAGWSWPAAP